MPYFNLGSAAQLYYEDCGTGQPIIFIHGVWMSSRFFEPQYTALSDRFRVIALDLRGHGRSTHTPAGHTVPTYAQDLRAFIQGLALDDVILAGWSMGAFVIWDYVKQFGTAGIKGTIVIDESASDFKWPDWSYGFADLPTLTHILATVQTARPDFVNALIGLMFKDAPDATAHRWMFDEITRLPESIATAILFDQTLQDYRPVLAQVDVPTLLCFGRDEKLIPVAAGEHLAQALPQARLVVFEESSHCPFMEEPERFNREVAAFVQGLG